MEVSGAKVPVALQNIFLCVQKKKETHTGLQQLDDRILILGWSIHLMLLSTYKNLFSISNCMINNLKH